MSKAHAHPNPPVETMLLTILFLMVFTGPAKAAVMFADDFENGNVAGWQFALSTVDTMGGWIIGDPVGTLWEGVPAQPEYGASGTRCAFTGQNPTGLPSLHDVDMGAVYLISPLIDLSSVDTAELSYYRWYYLRDFNEDHNDFFEVQARPDDQADWVSLERLGNTTRYNFWTLVTIPLHEYIPLTATVRLRFIASDALDSHAGNIIEAAVDAVVITGSEAGCVDEEDCGSAGYCAPSGECIPYGDGDCDADGDVDLCDCARFQACFGLPADGLCLPANLAGDAVVGGEDLAALLTLLDGPG